MGERLNFDWLTPTLALGGSFPATAAAGLARDHDIRAVVDLRAEARDEAQALAAHGIAFLHLPTDDHHPLDPAMLDDGLAFAALHLDRGERVLIHCQHGIGRAPSLALCVLVARGMEPLAALSHMKDSRPVTSPSPAQYEAWADWLHGWKARHGAPWDVPAFDSFARIAYRHLAQAG